MKNCICIQENNCFFLNIHYVIMCNSGYVSNKLIISISRSRNQFTATNLARDLKDARLKISPVEKIHRMKKRYHLEKNASMNFSRCEECVE